MEHPSPTNEMVAPEFLSGGGELGRRIREYDWSKTSLGPVETWPQSLRSVVSICLNSNFPIAIYWGPDLVLVYNDAWSPIPGNKHPWALGRPAKDVWPDIWNDIEPQFQKAFEGKPGGSNDALLPMQRHGYTEECYFDFTFTPVYGEGGNVEGVFNAVIETTFRILSERRTAFVRNLALSVAAAKRRKEVFEQAVRFIKHNPEDIPFAVFYRVVDEKAVFAAATVDEEFIRENQKKDWPCDKILETGQGIFIKELTAYFSKLPQGYWPEPTLEGYILPLKESNGVVHSFLVCGLSPRHRFDQEYQVFLETISNALTTVLHTIFSLEEERSKAAALAEIDKAKTAFFTNISHEFRTPLTLMLGTLEELIHKPGGEFGIGDKEKVETSHRNALRLLRLVNNLLDFSRLEAGRVNARFQLTDIASFTENLASNFRSAIENAGLAYNVCCDKIDEPVYVDKEMWEKVVLNLLSNAFKYTLDGSIKLSLTTESNNVVLKVTDTGVGIPEAELSNMFQRFHRIQNLTGRSFEGSGIGLSLVKELVQLHGGEISVTSQQGVGSTFTVTIPTGKAHLPPAQILTDGFSTSETLAEAFLEEARSLVEKPQIEKIKLAGANAATVLVVDDNPDMRHYIANLLQTDFNVITANNGRDALQKIKEHEVNLVVSDVMMPVMDGIELLKAIKDLPQTTTLPVILVSARAGEEARIEGFDIGADDYLIKPFSSKELLARVRSQIAIAHKREHALRDIYNMFDEVPFAVAVLKGEDLVIEYINQYNLKVWQRKKEQILGKPLFEARPDIRASAEGLHREVYETGNRFVATEIPVELLRDNKTELRYFNAIIDPLRNEEGKIIGQLATSIDITEQVLARKKIEEVVMQRTSELTKANEALVASNQELIRLNQNLEDFAYAASHDMKEPIRKIHFFSDRLKSQLAGLLSEEQKQIFERLENASRRMALLIDDLLDYSQTTKGPADVAAVDLNHTVRSVLEDLDLEIQQREAKFTIDPLPIIKGNQRQLQQLFQNLITNALKYSKEDVRPEIAITAESVFGKDAKPDFPEEASQKEFYLFRVTDNGIGFRQEDAERIFNVFTRLHGNAQYKGTGVGLSIAQKVVHNHNGYIWAESRPHKGTSFKILLPKENTL